MNCPNAGRFERGIGVALAALSVRFPKGSDEEC